MMLADDKKELVFLYGAQCRDGMMDSKLDRAEQVGVGIAPGSLLSVSGLPVMVSGDGSGKVRGEIYRVDPNLLGELDAIMAETARIVGNGSCSRKRIRVIEVRYGRPAMEVWVWQWEDLEGPQELITFGDWIDRQTAPWFTFIALACLLAGLLIPGVFAALVTPSRPVPVAFWICLAILILLTPFAGLGAAWFAHRRRERMSGCLLFIVAGLLMSSLLVLLAVSKRFL